MAGENGGNKNGARKVAGKRAGAAVAGKEGTNNGGKYDSMPIHECKGVSDNSTVHSQTAAFLRMKMISSCRRRRRARVLHRRMLEVASMGDDFVSCSLVKF